MPQPISGKVRGKEVEGMGEGVPLKVCGYFLIWPGFKAAQKKGKGALERLPYLWLVHANAENFKETVGC